MTIAQEFAELYIACITNRNSGFDEFVLSMYDYETLKEIIVALYWTISESYDLQHHAPVPEGLWFPLMDYNFEHILQYIFDRSDVYNIMDIMFTMQMCFDNGMTVNLNVQ